MTDLALLLATLVLVWDALETRALRQAVERHAQKAHDWILALWWTGSGQDRERKDGR